ncbi:uncharacterized protein MONBRDRAFT_24773 [Monosiga brevicollis MX1]|uniref:Alpha-ketoglutarate-dependent dioxygenase AlkB-like domain-containing protein n=1 Tax=Monosiga brevicollis TaxID=81824 RepID=A9UXP3_MONBE|nr:uncharacterized protein MONBRDRAFT_24773 [Monosiga brevicollis MX1]EDQ89878.1 predicted protein [Monosiga brevicollis MX1]|eukprot:XP_001745300.1 hypothetical protein [Monosiga brevicollis MX1]
MSQWQRVVPGGARWALAVVVQGCPRQSRLPGLGRALGVDHQAAAANWGVQMFPEVITGDEEAVLLAAIERPLRRKRYSGAHFDGAIRDYREIFKQEWPAEAQEILDRVRARPELAEFAFNPAVHVLDLAPAGEIWPHVDSIKHAGPVIVGLSLLTQARMDFAPHEGDEARFHFTHAVTATTSTYEGNTVERDRRISLLFRQEPSPAQLDLHD